MDIRPAIRVAPLLLLASCGGGTADRYAIHDSKYSLAGDCVHDSVTGLTWEVKLDRPGLRDWRNTYTWFDPAEAHEEIDYRGTADGGDCAGSACDSWDFQRAVNETGLCGYSDWRVPMRDELYSISDLRKAGSPPTINTRYFPHTQASEYWSSNDYSFQPDSAWAWNFEYGHDRVDWKESAKHLRLVRGEASQLEQVKE